MKDFFIAVGKALLYFSLLFATQLVSGAIVGIVISVRFILEHGPALFSDLRLLGQWEAALAEHTTGILLVSNLFALLMVWATSAIQGKSVAEQIPLRPCPPRVVFLCAAFGLGFAYVSGFVIGLIPFPESMLSSFDNSYAVLAQGNPIVAFLSVAILAPLTEEVFFRGLIYTRLHSGMPVPAAAVISSLLFAVLHGEVVWMASAFLAGMAMVWVFEKARSLWGCIAVHAVNNVLSQLLPDTAVLPPWAEWMVLVASALIFAAAAVCLLRGSRKALPGG